ncbi:MAG: hypothetical protein JXQ73_17405 [Phycisphaerae bacterium]|nr:hypothetical protein [Phycisphaerae bacterium]
MKRVQRSCRLGAILVLALAAAGAAAEASDDELMTHGDGEWARDYQFRPIVKQAVADSSGRIVSPAVKGLAGAWRCEVEPGPNAKGTGIVVLAGDDGQGGLECLMGGTGQMRGLTLRTADGKVLWQDAWAPWMDYEPCVVEVVVERGRVRAQLLDYEGKRLISQSDWIQIDAALTSKPGLMGLMTDKGIGRFWDWRIAAQPLAAVTPDAPNKRRIVPGDRWAIVGPITWQWTTAAKQCVRQTADVDRAWLFDKQVRGSHRRWSCHVKVMPPSGGAGMVFQADGTSKNGLLAWLGGTYGDGCLILYDLTKGYGGAIWTGPQGKWKYNTEYVLVGETKPGQVRAQLLAADGKTILSESPWKTYDKAVTDREGVIGFHTWKGASDFWAFSEGTQLAGAAGKPAAATEGPKASASGFEIVGSGSQRHIVHASKESHTWIDTSIKGIHGLWRVTVAPKGDGRFDLCFQISERGDVGFLARLDIEGGKTILKLMERPDKVLWFSKPIQYKVGTSYVLEGMTTTDRVRARLYSGDGKTLLTDSDQNYVSDAHNTRTGYLGLGASGDIEFSDCSFKKE